MTDDVRMARPEPARTGEVSWRAYTQLLRELDQAREREERRTAGARQRAAQLTEQVESLSTVVMKQQDDFGVLARRLRFRVPRLTPLAPRPGGTPEQGGAPDGAGSAEQVPPLDPADELAAAARGLDRASSLGAQAERRGRQATFLPNWPVGLRNAVIYAGCTVVLEVLALLAGQGGNGFVILILAPLLAFLAGLLVIHLVGKVRILPEPPARIPYGQKPPPDPNRSSVRAGLLICLLTTPLIFAVVVLVIQPLTR